MSSVEGKEKIASPVPRASWTRPDDYLEALARKRTYRRAREGKPPRQPEAPRPWLSTVPFVALFALLAVLAVAIMIAAFPGNQPRPKPQQPAAREQGFAERGWFQQAQKEMHR